MIFTLFITSLFGIIIIFSLKILEIKKEIIIIPKSALDKSDNFIKRKIEDLKDHHYTLKDILSDTPIFFGKFVKITLQYIKRLRHWLKIKLIKWLKIEERFGINRKRGAVSLFLRTISEDIEKKKK